MRKLFFLLAVSLTLTTVLYAQDAETEPETLNEKYHFLKRKSNTWENYKVIREGSLDAFWKNVQDSVRTLKSDLAQANLTIRDQQAVVDEQQSQMQKLQGSLAESESRNNRISFLGIYIMQDTYSSIVWGIIGLLLVLLIVGIVKYQSNDKITRKKTRDLDELSAEFEEYRKIVRQREIRIKRELQTASNKLEEIKHRASAR